MLLVSRGWCRIDVGKPVLGGNFLGFQDGWTMIDETITNFERRKNAEINCRDDPLHGSAAHWGQIRLFGGDSVTIHRPLARREEPKDVNLTGNGFVTPR